MLDPHVRRVLDGAPIAHLATLQPDGSPHATPVYVGTHGDHIVLFTGPDKRKARNLRATPAWRCPSRRRTTPSNRSPSAAGSSTGSRTTARGRSSTGSSPSTST